MCYCLDLWLGAWWISRRWWSSPDSLALVRPSSVSMGPSPTTSGWWSWCPQTHARPPGWNIQPILFLQNVMLLKGGQTGKKMNDPGEILSLILYFCSWFRRKDTAEPSRLLRLMQCWFILIIWPKEVVHMFLVFWFFVSELWSQMWGTSIQGERKNNWNP